MLKSLTFAVLAAATEITSHAAAAETTSTMTYSSEIGEFHQLFADDYRIESMTDVERQVTPARKRPQPVLLPDRPWEKDAAYLYGTVIYDEEDQLYKMWYQTFYKKPPVCYILYATSTDGISWDKPDLGVVEWEGNSQNNIVLQAEIGTVVKDELTTDPSRRYKMFGFIRPHYDAFFSPDGIHWTKSQRDYVLREGDVANVGYDPYEDDFYVLAKLPHPSGRAAFLSRSHDFENWTTGVPVMVADKLDQGLAVAQGTSKMEIYGMSAAPYEGCYIGFPWMFRISGKGAKDTGGDGRIDVQFAFSRDLHQWSRPVREPIIALGSQGSFDDEMVFTSSAPVIRGDEVRMYYGAWDGPHGTFDRKAYVGLATWERDRFLALTNGGFTVGTVTTKGIRSNGGPLHVNSRVFKDGELRAELLDENSMTLPGYTAAESNAITGDSLDSTLTWGAATNLTSLTGRDIKIRFHLRGGSLYSFWQK